MSYHTLPLFAFQSETREIPLTHGKSAIVDAADFEWLMQWKWFAIRCRQAWYVTRRESLPGGGRRRILLHRVILDAPDGVFVDHVDMNGLNNTRSNLRLATSSENARNRRQYRNNTSGYKGVDFHKASNKWRARITVNWQVIDLGFFESAEEAAVAYDDAARILHGEFARTNGDAYGKQK